MKLGFHLPVYLNKREILSLGDKLLGTGIYNWMEIKYPYGIKGCNQKEYVDAIEVLIERYNPGISLHIPTNLDLAMNNTYVRDKILREIRKCIDFAGSIGASTLPIHPGTIGLMDIPTVREPKFEKLFEEVKRKKNIARCLTIGGLKELGKYAEKYNMVITIENVLHEEEIVYTPDDLLSIIKEVDLENVRALADVGHANRVGINPVSFIKELGSYLYHVHLSDNDGSCDLHLPLGSGTIDFKSIMEALQEMNYDRAVIVEIGSNEVKDYLKGSDILGNQYFK